MPLIDREGIFRATPVEFVKRPAKDGAKTVMLGLKFVIAEYLEAGEWKDWREFGYEAFGDYCVVKKDGTLNETTVEFLRDGLGWDGQTLGVDGIKPCQIVVKAEEYKGKPRFKPEWINPWDHEGGGMAAATPDDERGFFAQFGPQLRAICGSKATAAPKPNGAPKAPPPAKVKAPTAPAPGATKTRPAPPPAPVAEKPKATTRDEAWNHGVDELGDKLGDDAGDRFLKEIAKVGPDESKFGPKEWSQVAESFAIPF